MPGDITNWLEESAVEDTLVQPLESIRTQDSSPDYLHADGEDGTDYGQEQEQPEEAQDPSAEPEGIPEATPEQLAEYQQEAEQWQALPQEHREQLADQYLNQAYNDGMGSVSPQEAKNFTDALGEHFGVPDLSSAIDPVGLAAFVSTWEQNVERTITLHPEGQSFLAALSDNRHPEKALQAAARLCDPVMVSRFVDHFSRATGSTAFAGRDPLELAAECIVDLARLNGWGQQSAAPARKGSRFQTNTDIFDEETLSNFQRL